MGRVPHDNSGLKYSSIRAEYNRQDIELRRGNAQNTHNNTGLKYIAINAEYNRQDIVQDLTMR
ncbi:MAG TPA: hypothetical protein DDX85_04715 [Nitrospiraceae bacterium]|nr:hypothetical protein [Nitrospiraceae bacterium]